MSEINPEDIPNDISEAAKAVLEKIFGGLDDVTHDDWKVVANAILEERNRSLASRSAEAGKPVVVGLEIALTKIADMIDDENADLDDAIDIALSALSTPADSEPVVACYQRRATVSGTPWVECPSDEATDTFKQWTGFEYRPLYAAPVADIEPVSVPDGHKRPDNLVTTETGMLVNGAYIYALEVALSTSRLAAAPQPNPSAVDALRAQNEWLKDRLSNLQLPAKSQKNIEEWLVECGMPAGDQP